MDAVEILKWVGIGLAAGFVGYFGRYLAMMIIERLRGGADRPPGDAKAAGETEKPPVSGADKGLLKLEKKKAKQLAKQTKKEGKR